MGPVLPHHARAPPYAQLVAGVLGDRLKPNQMLALGLLATAATNAVFGMGSHLAWFVTLWILNGLFQGTGAPACARLLTKVTSLANQCVLGVP